MLVSAKIIDRHLRFQHMVYTSVFIPVVSTAPLLKDLYQHITPQYAADWKVIGSLLGLPSGELKAIEAGYPTNVQ